VPGETIFINAEIVNNSNTDINRTHASLKQVCQLLVGTVENHGKKWPKSLHVFEKKSSKSRQKHGS